MSLANKSFKNNLTGEIVTVIDSFENIAILENKQKVNVNALMNPALYTEEIDPLSFFNNQGAYNILAEKIKNIPTDQIVDDSGEVNVAGVERIDIPRGVEESIVSMTTEEDEKAALAAKYGIVSPPVESLQRQNEAFAKILGEDSQDELPQVPQYQQPVQEQVTRVEVNREPLEEVNREYVQPVQRVEVEDPIIKMFKGVKRIVEFNINLDIKNKIPRLDFIEMMEDSYETSIIDFLADEFTNELLKNPEVIRSMIKSKINTLVYGKDKVESFPKPINDQITDSVTQKPTPTSSQVIKEGEDPVKTTKTRAPRKPRVKKEMVK
jgi:hypothetical protein